MIQKQAELMEQFYSGQANFDMKRAWQAKLNVEPELFKWIDIRYEADTDSSRTVPLEQLFKENGVNASFIDFDKEAIDEGIETSPSPSESSQTQDQVETMDEETREDDQGEELPLQTEKVSRRFDCSGDTFYTKGNTGGAMIIRLVKHACFSQPFYIFHGPHYLRCLVT